MPFLTDLPKWNTIPAVSVKQGKALAKGNQKEISVLLGLIAKDRFITFNEVLKKQF